MRRACRAVPGACAVCAVCAVVALLSSLEALDLAGLHPFSPDLDAKNPFASPLFESKS